MNYRPTILYVEDEEGIRNNVKRPLAYFSSELFIAFNGKEGLELYKKHTPDIVITDIKMPYMSGIEMSKEIKRINPKQYIIFTTAHNDSSFFLEAIEIHIDAYILKPIDLDILEDKIESLTEQINIKREFEIQKELTREISQLQDNCLAVFGKDEELIFLNDKFLEFTDVKDLDHFLSKYKHLYSNFAQNNGYFYPNELDNNSWIEQLQNIDKKDRLISMMDKNRERQTFLVSLNRIEENLHTIITFTEMTDIALETKEFKIKAYRDELTQICNRRYFEEFFEKEIEKYQETNRPLSFIILDIDKFKLINDNYGHQVGDDILIELAQIIKKSTRKEDIFARWGGEEFVKILPNTTLKNAKRVANNLRSMIEKHIFKSDMRITCSFGVSEFILNDTKKDVIKRADDALYLAKQGGRNLVKS